MTKDSIVRRVTEIQDRVDATTRVLGVVEPFVSKTPVGPRRLLLVNLIIGATDQRVRQVAELRRLLRSNTPRIERDVGVERAAEYFAEMAVLEATERAAGGTWREILTSLVVAAPISSA